MRGYIFIKHSVCILQLYRAVTVATVSLVSSEARLWPHFTEGSHSGAQFNWAPKPENIRKPASETSGDHLNDKGYGAEGT